MTANDTQLLPGVLRDRLRVITVPPTRIEHLPQLARTIVSDIARDRSGDPRWFPDLDNAELAITESLRRGASMRRLAAIVERIVSRRQTCPHC